MIKTKEEAIERFQIDIVRWRKDLTALEAGGYGRSGAANAVRAWIKGTERLVRLVRQRV